MTRIARISRGFVALTFLAGLVGGVPWALWHYIGWPLPHRLPTWAQFTTALDTHGIPDETLLKALACVVWITWAILAASVLVELPAALHGRTARRLGVAGPIQLLVGNLVTAVIVAALAVAPRPGPTVPRPLGATVGLGGSGAPAAIALVDEQHPPAAPAQAASNGSAPPADNDASSSTSTYVVQRNDTLWGIAERELGDPLRWSEIYAVNQGRQEPDGMTLDDPNWIYPGWTLLLPAPSGQPAAPPPDAPAPVNPPPTTAQSPPTTSTTTVPALPHHPTHRAPSEPHERTSVASSTPAELPSGSVVAASFVAGVLSAVAVGRLRQRHGYRPSPPEPGRVLSVPALGPTIRRLAAATSRDEPPDESEDSSSPTDDRPLHLPEDVAEHRERPDLIEIGERDGTNVTVALSDFGGIALCGTQADDVVRAWIAALLTRSGALASEVLVTSSALVRLLPAVGEVPGIRVVDDTERLMRILEAEVLGRIRILDETQLDDVVSYRRDNPAEPVPFLFAVVDDVSQDMRPRLLATFESAPRLGIGAVLLNGPDDSSLRVELDDRRVVATSHEERAGWLVGTRMFSLDVSETTDVLGALAQAEFRPTSEENPEWTEVIERMEQPPPPTEPWPVDNTRPAAGSVPIVVRALGPLLISVGGKTIGRGLRSVAKELLTFYLLRPEGASVEEAVDKLWPDTDPKLVHRQFWTAASNLRSRLREGTECENKVLDQEGDVYRLDPEVMSADLWDFQRVLAEAAHAEDEETTVAALRQAVEIFGGDLAQGAGWLWVEPAREDLHRRAVDAHLRLAELEERRGNLPAAEAVLERVVDLDRYAEEPYRRFMVLLAGQGRIEAVRATWRLLQRRLLELDLDPDPASGQLYCSLVEPDLARPAGAPGRLPGQGGGLTL